MKRFLLMGLGLMLLFALCFAEQADYVGAKKCRSCHSGVKNKNVYEKWEKAVHAKAFETLKAKGEEKNPKCLGCHVTGFNEGGYKLGAANAADFEGVQCESCHGPGSLYKSVSHMKDESEAVEQGLMIPIDALCTTCHNQNSPHFKGFNYDEYVKRITHTYRGI